MCEKEEKKKEYFQLYLNERRHILNLKKDASYQLDKAILSLSGGALVLSITLIDKIVSDPKPWTYYLLICAWCFFIGSLLSTLLSFLLCQKACDEQIYILGDYLLKGKKVQFGKLNKWLKRINIISILLFILGTLLLVSFSGFNLKMEKEEKMNDENNVKEEQVEIQIEKGSTMPDLPLRPDDIVEDTESSTSNDEKS